MAVLPLAILATSITHAQNLTDPVLSETVVTATRSAAALSDVTAEVVVIDRELIEQAGVSSLAALLQRVAGIQISSNGGLGKNANVFIRGTESRHTLLLIDGVRYGSATLGAPNWDNIPLEAIERIEVLKGPGSALYGSDAVGGVVQIFTRRGNKGVQPYAHGTLGEYGHRAAGAGVSGAVDGVAFAVGFNSLSERGFSATNAAAPFGNFNPDRDGFDQQSVHANAQWKLAPGWALEGNVLMSKGDSRFDSKLNGSANFDVRGKTTTRTTGLGLVRDWSPGIRTVLRWSTADDLTLNLYATTNTHFDTRRQQSTLQHEHDTPVGTFTAGLERVEESVHSTTPYDVTRREVDGVFLGLQGVQDRHSWQASVRRDDNSQFGGATTGYAGYGYKITPALKARLAHGTSFKAPTFNSLYYPEGGNPLLKPERGSSNDLGFEYTQGKQTFAITYFDQQIRDLINWAPSGPGGAWQPSNIDKADIHGWSLAWQGAADDWRWRSALELLDARNRAHGANFDKKLQRRADEQLTVSIERVVDGWWIGAHALVVSERFENAANTRRLSGYGVLDLSAERSLTSEWTLQVRLNNVGDKRYETALGFNQPGRSAYVTLRWQAAK